MKEESPKASWKSMQVQANRMLGDQFWKDLSGIVPHRNPRMDMYDLDNEIVVEIELPGLSSSRDVKVTVSRKVLTVKGELHRINSSQIRKEQLFLNERIIGSFQRKLDLPESVLPQEVKAYFFHGLLEIRMKKEQNEEESPIDIQFEEG